MYTRGLSAYPFKPYAPGLGRLGAVYENPTVTGVVQLMDYGNGFVQVRLSASGANFGLNGSPDILDGLRQAVGYCVKVAGHYDGEMGGYQVTGWTLLTDDSAGDVPYTSCADILAGSATAGQVPTGTVPPSGGGDQPAPSSGQTPAQGSTPAAGASAPGATIAGIPVWLALGLVGALVVMPRRRR